jgi:RNA:NAD 2'-phosphotransferase (TPT1/KptA family)
MNTDNISEKGLLINGGRNTGSGAVYMTDGLDPGLLRWLDTSDNICFCIDLEKLKDSGHRVFELNRFHEYITDFVPPDCLVVVNERLF